MKKIVLFVLTLSMITSVLLPFSAGAASSEAYVYGFGGTSVNGSPSKNDVVAANGLLVQSAIVPSLSNGVMSVSAPGTSGAFIDLQMFHISSYSITESFKLYIKMKPLQEDLSMGGAIAWRQDTSDSTWDKGSITLSNGSFNIGSSTGKKLPLDAWSVVTFEYHYDTQRNVFDTVTLAVDGETVGTASCEGSPTIIKQWRLFQFGKGELAFDYIAVVPNSNTSVTLDTDADVGTDTPEDVPPAVDSTEEYIFGFAGDSVNQSFSPTDIAKSGGIALNSGLMHKVGDGAITLYAAGEGFIDLQMYHVGAYNIRETFKLSMKFMPLQDNLNMGSPVAWRQDNNDKSWDKGDIKFSNGAIGVGSVMSNPLETYKWSVIDIEYHYNSASGVFDTFRIYVNGTSVAGGVCPDSPPIIKHWRLFQFCTGEFALDYVSVIPNSNKNAIPDTDADADLGAGGGVYEGEVGTLPVLPSVDDSQKKDVEYIFSADLSADGINTSDPDAKGFYLDCVGDSSRYEIDGSELYFGDSAFVQMRIGEDVRETFTLSFRLMPLVSALDGNSLICWRGSTQTKWETESIRLYDGQLIVNKKNCGMLPVDKYTLIEVVFRYGENGFDSYSVLVNGTKVAEAQSAVAYEYIGQIRALQFIEGEVAIADVSAIMGSESVLYANPYVAPVGGGDEVSDTETDGAPEQTVNSEAPETEVPVEDNSKESGCGAAVGISYALMMSLCACAGVLCSKKIREDA